MGEANISSVDPVYTSDDPNGSGESLSAYLALLRRKRNERRVRCLMVHVVVVPEKDIIERNCHECFGVMVFRQMPVSAGVSCRCHTCHHGLSELPHKAQNNNMHFWHAANVPCQYRTLFQARRSRISVTQTPPSVRDTRKFTERIICAQHVF